MQETIRIMPETSNVPPESNQEPPVLGHSNLLPDLSKAGQDALEKSTWELEGAREMARRKQRDKDGLPFDHWEMSRRADWQRFRDEKGNPFDPPPGESTTNKNKLPPPMVPEVQPTDHAVGTGDQSGAIGAAGTEVKPPPETKQDSAKVEQPSEELSPQGKVDSAQRVFKQAESAYSNTLREDQVSNSAVKDSRRQWDVYKEALGKSGLDQKNFENTSEGQGISNELGRRLDVVDAAEKAFQATEQGKKLLEERNRAGKSLNDAKKALAPTEPVVPPATEPVIEKKPDDRDMSQSAWLKWLGVLNADGKGSGRLGVEVMEQLRQIHETKQKLELRFELELKGVFEDLSSKAFDSAGKLAKKIGSGVMKLLKTGAIIGGSPFLATAYVAESAIAGAAGVVPAVEHLRSKAEGNIAGRLTAEGKGNMPQAETARQMSEKFQNAADRHRKSIEEWRPFKRFIRALRGSKSKVSLPSPQPERIEEYEEAQVGSS